jgi:hypothetical protein
MSTTHPVCTGVCDRLADPFETHVRLLSGVEVCRWCPGWLAETAARETEARAVLRMADRETRIAHLAAREAQFGAEYRSRLEAVVLDLWRRKAAALPEPDDQS